MQRLTWIAEWSRLLMPLLVPLLVGTLLVPNAGEDKFLQNMVNKTASQDLEIRLYKNNITPGETDTAATYTAAAFTGYAAAALAGAGWTVTPGAPSEAAFAQQTFTSSADQATEQIYGYYVVGGADGVLRWAERFSDGPYPISFNGDNVKISPRFTAD